MVRGACQTGLGACQDSLGIRHLRQNQAAAPPKALNAGGVPETSRGSSDPASDHPFKVAAVAELVFPRRGGDAVERCRGVDLEGAGGLVGLQLRVELGFLVEHGARDGSVNRALAAI